MMITMMITKMITMTSTNSEKRSNPRHRKLRSVAKPPHSSPRIANSATMGANASTGSAQPLSNARERFLMSKLPYRLHGEQAQLTNKCVERLLTKDFQIFPAT